VAKGLGVLDRLGRGGGGKMYVRAMRADHSGTTDPENVADMGNLCLSNTWRLGTRPRYGGCRGQMPRSTCQMSDPAAVDGMNE